MTASLSRSANEAASRPHCRRQEHRIQVRGRGYRLRLVGFPAGWLASVDTAEGPTLGCDASPYLAVSRAVEPIGGELVGAMSIVCALRLIPPNVGDFGGHPEALSIADG